MESLLQRYWEHALASKSSTGSELHGQLEAALSVFGNSVLTRREAEIMRLYLYGHDTQTIGERLDISAHTVATHRKNAYARLDITSQSQLFSLFINAIYCFDGDHTQDPLKNYMEPSG